MNVIHHLYSLQKMEIILISTLSIFFVYFLSYSINIQNIAELESPSVFEIFYERWVYSHYVLVTLLNGQWVYQQSEMGYGLQSISIVIKICEG